MSKQPPPAPTASAVGPCPTLIQIVGRPGTGSLPSTIAPPDHPLFHLDANFTYIQVTGKNNCFACLRMLVFDKKKKKTQKTKKNKKNSFAIFCWERVAVRPINLDKSRARATWCKWGLLGFLFSLVYHFSLLSLSVRARARYRLKMVAN